jgi:D-sedoheptulose 7-phosphate isomerase
MHSALRAVFAASIRAKQHFLREHGDALISVVQLIARVLESGNKLLIFGNGGSAADAQHIAAEYVNRFALDRDPLPAIALTTDTSVLTSIANDFGYDEVFAKQVRALGRRGDLAIAISTSGGSRSVLRAVQVCKELGIHTVGLTGGGGGELGTLVDHHLCVCSTANTARIQETHILIGHATCELVERLLFGDLRSTVEPPAASPSQRAPGVRRPRVR